MDYSKNKNMTKSLNIIYRQISEMMSGPRPPHALLFETADKEAAGSLCTYTACAALCEKGGDPCGTCLPCRKAAGGMHPDVTVLEGTGSRSLHVDDIRIIRQDAYIRPNEGRRKVYIIKNAGDISAQSQNALLKILEEPPEYVLFILTARSRTELLPTVISRVQSFIINTDNDSGEPDDKEIDEVCRTIAEALIRRDEYALAVKCSAMSKSRRQAEKAITGLYRLFTSALFAKYLEPSSDTDDVCTDIAAAFGSAKIRRICDILSEAAGMLDKNINSTLMSVYLPSRLTDLF